MRFGPTPIDQARGGIAVHSIRSGDLVLKKGTIIGEAEIAKLRAAGMDTVVVAQLEPDDVPEDTAALEIAAAAAGDRVRVDHAFTGRCNLFAASPGILVVDAERIAALNSIDESVTLAALPAFRPVVAGEMIATVKIIPFAVAAEVRDRAVALASQAPVIRVAPYQVRRVGVISTVLPGLADKVIEKTVKVTAERLAAAGAEIVAERRVPHETAALKCAIEEILRERAELVIVFGASAIADRRDVIPAAIEAAGGSIDHFGMPVDPGNLLLLGHLGERPVLGAPGCARSPKENGFDWVLNRLLAGLEVTPQDIAAMGVGGLLMEIVTRPQPREEEARVEGRNVAGLLLAAGQSRRMLGPNKLLADLGGKPLVRRVAEELLASKANPVIVVTGHQSEAVEAALAGLPLAVVHNPDFAEGLSTSLRTGVGALPESADAVIVCLGDMPAVRAKLLDRIIEAFAPEGGDLIVVPTLNGKRGNPVLWARRFFHDLQTLQGDVGARHLIGTYADAVAELAVSDPQIFADVDTPEALATARAMHNA
jgi:molybdenum cofactor cytidylyltransferase